MLFLSGIAFDNVVGPVHIAASMTGTDAALLISGWDLPDVNGGPSIALVLAPIIMRALL